jgi:hypothetical protein
MQPPVSLSQQVLLPVTQRTTEEAAARSALIRDGDGRDDGTRTSDWRRVCDGDGDGDAQGVGCDAVNFAVMVQKVLVEVVAEIRLNTCDKAWQNKL